MDQLPKAYLDKYGFLKIIIEDRSEAELQEFASKSRMGYLKRSVDVDPGLYPGAGTANGHPESEGDTFIFREDAEGAYIEKNGKAIPKVLISLYAACKEKALANPGDDDEFLWDKE